MEKTDMVLIILDVQVHMFSPENPVYQGEHLLEKIGHLQEKAHQAHTPIIYVQQGRPRKGHPLEVGSSGWQLHPILVPVPTREDTHSPIGELSLAAVFGSNPLRLLALLESCLELLSNLLCLSSAATILPALVEHPVHVHAKRMLSWAACRHPDEEQPPNLRGHTLIRSPWMPGDWYRALAAVVCFHSEKAALDRRHRHNCWHQLANQLPPPVDNGCWEPFHLPQG